MAPPKRSLFSLNLDTQVEPDSHQRVSRNYDEEGGTDHVKVIETKPGHTRTDLQYVTKPFETLVNRTVNEVIDGTGKKVRTADGELSYSHSTSSSHRRSTNDSHSTSRLNVVSKTKRRAIEKKYDTSEL